MSEVLDRQVYALLARLHATREAGCAELRQAAAAQAQQLVSEARRRARQHVKDAVLEKRRRVMEHCRRVRVELEARHRDVVFTALGARLADGLAALPAALAARWQDAGARRDWCHHVLAGAAAMLRPGAWRILVAPGLGADDTRELAAAASTRAGADVTVETDPALEAGLVVLHEGTRYDGSVAGLLADGNGVQAALLAELAALEPDA